MKKANWHMAVLIPARDEEALLERCLRSVQEARLRLPAGVTSDIVVVSDRSVDGTLKLAKRLLGTQGIALATDAGQVGSARALAAKMALQRYPGPHHRCWLANTDADCAVPPDWLLRQLEAAESGATAVAGIVGVDSFAEHGAEVEERFRASYCIHPDGTHPHVHGANIGVRADSYLRAGGWMDLATAEDHDLWHRLQHHGERRLSDARLWVMTSGRRIGRAPMGFAAVLAAHNEALA
jgi:glycosyltransferase involved in cell wall biosynthesis